MRKKESFNFGVILILIIFIGTLINHSISFFNQVSNSTYLETWDLLTDKESQGYSKFGGLTLIFELAGNIIILLLNLTVVVLGIMKSKAIKRVILGYFLVTLTYIIADIYLTRLTTGDSRINTFHLDWFAKTFVFGLFILIYIYRSKKFNLIFSNTEKINGTR
jgi:hypothetical protein